MPTDYSKSKIYKLVCDHTDKVYIGSTTNILSTRLAQHKIGYNRWKKTGKQYVKSYDLFDLGSNDVKIYLIEQYACKTREELHARERYYIENINTINKNIPGRTWKQYYETNKDQILLKRKEYYESNKEYKKDYYENNKNKKLEYAKEYYKNNKDQLLQKSKEHYETDKDHILEKRKEYYEANKTQIKQYYQVNKDQIRKRETQQFVCECGSSLTQNSKGRHYKTKKHLDFINFSNGMLESPKVIDESLSKVTDESLSKVIPSSELS